MHLRPPNTLAFSKDKHWIGVGGFVIIMNVLLWRNTENFQFWKNAAGNCSYEQGNIHGVRIIPDRKGPVC